MNPLDIRGGMADHPHMWFRAVISMLMIVFILPWGAFASGPLAAAPQVTHQSAADFNQTDYANLFDAKGAEVSARKSCRTAVLPGAPCGPDLVLPGMPAMATNPAGPIVRAHLADRQGQGRRLSPPRDPPRRL